MINFRRVQQQANKTARSYEKSFFVQQALAERLFQRLEYIRIAPERILDLGCGTGWLAARLKAQYSGSSVISMDFAIERLKYSGSSVDKPVAADMHALPLQNDSVDLIILNDSLHWVAEPAMVLKECYRVLSPGGLVMLSTLGPNTLQPLAKLAMDHNMTTQPHSFMDMHDLGDELMHAGFADPVMDSEVLIVRYQSHQQIAKDVHRLGVGAMAPEWRGLITPKRWRALWDALPCTADDTYEVDLELIQGHAWKVSSQQTSRLNDQGEAVIPLSALKAK